MWQHRYAKTAKPVTLREALVAKEEREKESSYEAGQFPTSESSVTELQRGNHPLSETKRSPQQSHSNQAGAFGRGSGPLVNSTMLGPRGNVRVGGTPPRASEQPKIDSHVPSTNDARSRLGEMDGLASEALHATSASLSKQHRSVVPRRLNDMRQTHATTVPQQQQHDIEPAPANTSYADALSGKNTVAHREMKLRAKMTLKAIGKALASGQKFEVDGDDDESDSDDNSSSISDANSRSPGSGDRGYTGKSMSGLQKRSSPEPSPGRAVGRGRASLISYQTAVLNTRPSELQSRQIGRRGRGSFNTVKVNFPSAEEMESAPDSVPVPAGSSFVTQRVT